LWFPWYSPLERRIIPTKPAGEIFINYNDIYPREVLVMDTFETLMKQLKDMSAAEQAKWIETNKALCICPGCPTHTNCAKNNKYFFCTTERVSAHLPQKGMTVRLVRYQKPQG
jgi:hypothetical protein